jgi:hypothetical protein
MDPPPMPEDPRDIDQLRLLVVFHYIYMGLQAAGLAFLGLHYFIMQSVFQVIEKTQKYEPKVSEKREVETLRTDGEVVPIERVRPPEVNGKGEEFFSEFGSLFIVFYAIGAVFLIIYLILNFLAARAISQRKSRTFSMVVAGFNCISFPLGTALGIFTLVVIGRQSVVTCFERNEDQSR